MNTHNTYKLSLIALAIITTQASYAQDNSPQLSEEKVEETVVWGTQINSSSVLLGDDQIAVKQSDHLSDLLRDIPGVDVGGSHALNQRINIRGMDDTDMDVTIDGARQNNYMYHHAGNLLVNTDILKEVDIQVGANSIINNKSAGAVSFETKDASELLGYGDTLGARLQTSYNTNSAKAYGLTGYAQLSDEFDVLGYFNTVERENPEAGDGLETLGVEGENQNYLVKLGYDLTEAHRFELSYDKLVEEGDFATRPDFNSNITDETVLYPTEYDRATTTLGYEFDKGNALTVRATLYQNEMQLWRDQTSTGGDINEGDGQNRGLLVLASSRLSTGDIPHNLTFGGEINEEKGEKYENGALAISEKATVYSIYAEDQIEINNRFSVTPGIRFDYYEMDAPKSQDTFDQVSSAIAGRYELLDGLNFNASYTQTFKGPELSEIFNAQGESVVYNPDLVPETGDNIEYGLEYRLYNFLGSDSFTAKVTAFKTDVDNKIEEDDYPNDDLSGRGAPIWEVNVGTVQIDGFEASLNYALGNFSALLSYANSESEVEGTGEPLDREVGDSIAARVEYMIPDLNLALGWNAQFTKEQEAFESEDSSVSAKPSYKVHNISARWVPEGALRGSSLTLGVDNILDELYVSHASRNATNVDYEPGRNVKLTASYSF